MEFTYFRGEWSETKTLAEWEGKGEIKDWVSECGFENSPYKFGNEYSVNCIDVYRANKTKTHGKFLAIVCPLESECYDVILPDFPSLMMFIRDYVAVFTLLENNELQEKMNKAFNKFFHAYHGHDVLSECQKCDPEAWEKSKEIMENIRKNKLDEDLGNLWDSQNSKP